MLTSETVYSVNLPRTSNELTMFEKGKSTRCTLFYYYVDDLCSIMCHKINMEKALLIRCRRKKNHNCHVRHPLSSELDYHS